MNLQIRSDLLVPKKWSTLDPDPASSSYSFKMLLFRLLLERNDIIGLGNQWESATSMS